MIHGFAVVVSVFAAYASPSSGQTPPWQSQTPQDSLTRAYVGTWQGSMSSPHGSADGLTLTVARDSAGAWTATMTLPPGQPMTAGALKDVEATAEGLGWTQTIGPMSCKGSAVLIGGTLRGETDCGHVSMAFLLRRK